MLSSRSLKVLFQFWLAFGTTDLFLSRATAGKAQVMSKIMVLLASCWTRLSGGLDGTQPWCFVISLLIFFDEFCREAQVMSLSPLDDDFTTLSSPWKYFCTFVLTNIFQQWDPSDVLEGKVTLRANLYLGLIRGIYMIAAVYSFLPHFFFEY